MKNGSRFNDATRPQIRAANPESASWVSANAGSGKTRVLTDRVARLLLAGTPPQRILCVTFANAAASNMQNRLIQRLGEWSMLPDGELKERLLDLGEDEDVLTPAKLARARTLFANALETPGGLKIQTLHAFASALLRQFPLEAGVSPQFEAIENRESNRVRDQVLERVALVRQRAFDEMARHATSAMLPDFVDQISANRHLFRGTASTKGILDLFGIAEGDSIAALARSMFGSDDVDLLSSLMSELERGTSSDNNAMDKLARLNFRTPGAEDLKLLESVMLFGGSASSPFEPKVGKFPTKKTRAAMGPDAFRLDEYMERVAAARAPRMALAAAEKSIALHEFAASFLEEFEERKRANAMLDFNDLILKALSLLSNPGISDWVLYRLDGGIDHILVDEAQDVSPVQWEIVSRLAEEFTAGSSARGDVNRTVFAVGDEKQSIYGFQGAAPEQFAVMRKHFRERFQAAEKSFINEELNYSFRSADAILRLVDRVFDGSLEIGFEGRTTHKAFKSDMPGRVDIWPFIEKSEDGTPPDWHRPRDTRFVEPPAHAVLAEQIADTIGWMIGSKLPRPDGQGGSRPISAGDILILVQRRAELFFKIIEELKVRNIPIAGTDRLRISEELAVKDLTCLLSFLAVESDDLSLAAVLKSPLFGLTESDLYELAANREEKSLYRFLLENEEKHPDVVRVLKDLKSRADVSLPYEILERVLGVHKGREKLVARLGSESTEGINALLNQAIDYEASETPSLTGFVEWLALDDLEIKRQLDQAGDEVRVMTVHGAKGLEAPVVFLPDTASRSIIMQNELFFPEGRLPIWKVAKAERPPAMAEAWDAAVESEKRERLRLLYVAMTRAESWLIVCGAGRLTSDGESWYQLIEGGLQSLGASEFAMHQSTGRRFELGAWPEHAEDAPLSAKQKVPLPDWAETPVGQPEPVLGLVAPSSLGGLKAIPSPEGEGDESAALQRGRDVHRLLEHLPKHPEENLRSVARNLLNAGEREVDESEFEAVFEEAKRNLGIAGGARLFAEDSLAEVGIAASLDELGGATIHGFIDRLLVEEDRVLAVDFKTNRGVPKKPEEIPEGVLRQMGAYQAALDGIYPDKKVETAILWTRTAELMFIPRDLCAASLLNAELPGQAASE